MRVREYSSNKEKAQYTTSHTLKFNKRQEIAGVTENVEKM